MTAERFSVLLVEDEPSDAHLVKMAVKESPLLVDLQVAVDGVDALEYLRNPEHTIPTLILLDINMPRMGGLEFLSIVKQDEKLRSIPVVVLTTSEAAKDINRSYELGAAGYVTKPVDITQFVKAIAKVDDYWLTLVKLPELGQ